MLSLNGKHYNNTDELCHDAISMNLSIPDEEKIKFDKYIKYVRLGKLLQQPSAIAILQIKTKNLNEPERGQLKISDSWVRNQYTYQHQNMAFVNFSDSSFGSSYFSMKNTAGTIKSNYAVVYRNTPETTDGYYAAAGVATRGIVIGTSDTSESLDHYALQTPIANGTGTGQMSFNACGVTKAWDSGAGTWTATWERIINNNSGDTITVNECGLYGYFFYYYDWPSTYTYTTYMMNRDKLSSGEAVLDAGQLTVTYNIVITYP